MADFRRPAPQQAVTCESLDALQQLIPTCEACPRLRTYCAEVAAEKVKRFAEWTYSGRPAPGFGDAKARLLVVGLAPAAHGANRTGRLFTGDRSGDFLFAALHRAGLASQPNSEHANDGLTLKDVYITAAGRCAPPDNKPTPEELDNCLPFLRREIELLPNLRALLALGGTAHDAVLRLLGPKAGKRIAFAHGAIHALPDRHYLVDSYHVSQQNTFTGRLTPAMFDEIIAKAMAL